MEKLVNGSNRTEVEDALRVVGYDEEQTLNYIRDLNSLSGKHLFTRDRRFTTLIGSIIAAGIGIHFLKKL